MPWLLFLHRFGLHTKQIPEMAGEIAVHDGEQKGYADRYDEKPAAPFRIFEYRVGAQLKHEVEGDADDAEYEGTLQRPPMFLWHWVLLIVIDWNWFELALWAVAERFTSPVVQSGGCRQL
jgi:hypothetical protein